MCSLVARAGQHRQIISLAARHRFIRGFKIARGPGLEINHVHRHVRAYVHTRMQAGSASCYKLAGCAHAQK